MLQSRLMLMLLLLMLAVSAANAGETYWKNNYNIISEIKPTQFPYAEVFTGQSKKTGKYAIHIYSIVGDPNCGPQFDFYGAAIIDLAGVVEQPKLEIATKDILVKDGSYIDLPKEYQDFLQYHQSQNSWITSASVIQPSEVRIINSSEYIQAGEEFLTYGVAKIAYNGSQNKSQLLLYKTIKSLRSYCSKTSF